MSNSALPHLIIPPDHPLAACLYDLIALQHALIRKQEEAYFRGDVAAQQATVKAVMDLNPKFEAIKDEYRQECGGKPGQKVSLTTSGGYPVVTARAATTRH